MSSLEDRLGLSGTVAVILGGGSGLGKACALEFARVGARVAVVDRDEAALEPLTRDIESEGGTVFGAAFDVRDDDAMQRFLADVAERFGPELHTLVNMVGGTFEQPFAESTRRGWAALTDSNLTWLLSAVQRALPMLRAAGGSSVINMSTIEAFRAAPGYAIYAGMKAAVESITRTLALELAADGIRINTVAPDVIPTEGWAALMNVGSDTEAVDLSYRIAIPMGRVGRPDEVSGCVLFLASRLATYVTGTCLHVDGGTSAAAGWFNWPGAGYRNRPPTELARRLIDMN